MKAKSTILAAAAAAVFSAGMVGEASASIYARSYLAIDNLAISLSDDGGTTPGTGGFVRNFTFFLTNTAFLNGAPAIQGASCFGSPTSNNCNAGPGPTLDAAPANAPGSNPNRGNNDFSFFGPGLNQYSNADSVIKTAQLVGGVPTSTEQIAESELQGGSTASASAEIQSLTGFTFAFTVAGENQIDISFDADSSRFVQINSLSALLASAQANMQVEFRLENDANGDSVVWRPNGNTGTGAGALRGDGFTPWGTVTELADDFDLQSDYGVSVTPTSCAGAPDPLPCPSFGLTSSDDEYALRFQGLYDGNWTLTLSALTSTSLTQTVPEPASLALVGMALAGMGFAARRRNRA